MGEILTTALPDVRSWAIQQGLAGTRGPIGYDVQVAYATAHGVDAPPQPEPRKVTVPRKSERRARKNTQCTCGREWEGLVECHCSGCHRHFRTVTWFDLHLVLAADGETSRCVDPATVTYRSGGKKGEPKMRLAHGHHGDLWTSAEERPPQESMFGNDAPADS